MAGRDRTEARPRWLPAHRRPVTEPDRPTGPAQPTAFGRAIDKQITFLRTGIDGLFTDQADVTVFARRHFLLSRVASPS